MWKHFGIIVFFGVVTGSSGYALENALLYSEHTQENVARLIALSVIHKLTEANPKFPIITPLPDPLPLNDTYITLPEGSGYITLCHSLATGTSEVTDDLSFSVNIPNGAVHYILQAPSVHIAGKHEADIKLLGGLLHIMSLDDYTADLTDGSISLDIELRITLDGYFDLQSASTEIGFSALALNTSGTYINDAPMDWEEFSASLPELWAAVWPQLKPRVDAQVLATATELLRECNIWSLIEGDFSCITARQLELKEKLMAESAEIFSDDEGICPLEPTTPAPDGSYIIYSENITNYGSWAREVDRCPENTIATGFQLKTEPNQSPFSDDTAMNGLRLFCGSAEKSVTSNEGGWGTWGYKYDCRNGGHITGFQFRQESTGALDNTAANNIRIFCSQQADFIEADGLSFGSWRSVISCDDGYAVCGLKTQVQPDQSPLNDDTALNNIGLLCCPL